MWCGGGAVLGPAGLPRGEGAGEGPSSDEPVHHEGASHSHTLPTIPCGAVTRGGHQSCASSQPHQTHLTRLQSSHSTQFTAPSSPLTLLLWYGVYACRALFWLRILYSDISTPDPPRPSGSRLVCPRKKKAEKELLAGGLARIIRTCGVHHVTTTPRAHAHCAAPLNALRTRDCSANPRSVQ